jgi:hypothetical protein
MAVASGMQAAKANIRIFPQYYGIIFDFLPAAPGKLSGVLIVEIDKNK